MCNLNLIKTISIIFLFCFFLSTNVAAVEVPTPGTSSQESVTIDFNNVDIRLVIKYLSELTKSNFVIDKDVSGKVSVLSPHKMTLTQARKVLETLLAINGYTIVESEGIKRIVPSSMARQAQMLTWIGKDPPENTSAAKMITQIVPLDYAKAEKIKEVLLPYVTDAGYVTSYAPTNTLIITESTANLTKLLSIVRTLDSLPPLARNDIRVIHLKNAKAKEVSEVLNSLFEEQRRQSSLQSRAQSDTGPTPSIMAHEGTNSIIVTASPQDYAIIEKTVKQLDVLKDQVFVEVLIVEMTLEKVAEYGLEFSQFGGAVFGSSSGFADVDIKGAFESILTGGDLPGKVLGAVEGSSTRGGIEVPNVGFLIKAFDNDKDINILSTPQIIATDNEQARILVGSRIAFIKNSQVTAEGGTVTTFEFRDIGLELVIRPHIGENDFVRLEVEQRTEDVIGESFPGAPETAKRETKTTVSVKNNNTIVLGGLIRDDIVKSVSKVPILGDIPFIKAAFRSEKTTVRKMNLLIFLTPHILRTSEMGKTLTEQKQQMMEEAYVRSKDEMKQIEKEKLPQSAFSIVR